MSSQAISSSRGVLPLNSRAAASDSYSSSETKGAFLDSLTNSHPHHAHVDKSPSSTIALTSQNAHLLIS
jgi:hypothetical protein